MHFLYHPQKHFFRLPTLCKDWESQKKPQVSLLGRPVVQNTKFSYCIFVRVKIQYTFTTQFQQHKEKKQYIRMKSLIIKIIFIIIVKLIKIKNHCQIRLLHFVFKFYNIFVMDDNLCKCHCGTRITIDEQLLQERQAWRQKYLCLQKQATNDIGRLKENIYAQCAALMQQQFNSKEAEQNQIVNQKNAEIKNLTSRVINLQAKVKILDKENEILRNKAKELELQVNDKEGALQNIRSRGVKSERDWQIKLQEQVTIVRKRITQQFQDQMQKLEAQNQHLRHKVKQFQKKYQIIIPEVEKLKNALNSKNQQVDQLQSKLDKLKKQGEQQLLRLKQELQQVEKAHSKCRGTIGKLSQKVENLTQQLESTRKVKKQVRVEPVYIQRPVQVEKIVQKIVEVQKIVTKYIEPTSFRDEQLQGQNLKLKQQINRLIHELQIFQDKYRSTVTQYEECIKQHEQNVLKYKKQREALARTIEEQHKQIDLIHSYLQKRKIQGRNNQAEKIVVHVNRDGTYQKTVEKLSSNSGVNIQTNNRVNKKR